MSNLKISHLYNENNKFFRLLLFYSLRKFFLDTSEKGVFLSAFKTCVDIVRTPGVSDRHLEYCPSTGTDPRGRKFLPTDMFTSLHPSPLDNLYKILVGPEINDTTSRKEFTLYFYVRKQRNLH